MTSSPASTASTPAASPPPSAATPSMREPAPSIVEPGERRLHRRARLDKPVLIETETRSGNARAVDVAAHGISVHTELPLRAGERVSIYFELPIGYAVETMAQVVRCDGDVVALRFVDPPREAVIAVRGFCRISGVMPAPVAVSVPRATEKPPSSGRPLEG